MFVAGRQILDIVLVANELVKEYRKAGRAGIVLKIDFEKLMIMWSGVELS